MDFHCRTHLKDRSNFLLQQVDMLPDPKYNSTVSTNNNCDESKHTVDKLKINKNRNTEKNSKVT